MAERGRPLTTGSAQLAGLTELNKRFTELQKEFAELRDQLNVFENWNSEIKKMYGKGVCLTTVSGARIEGTLIWTDRYCICVKPYDTDPDFRRIFTKGGLISIEPVMGRVGERL